VIFKIRIMERKEKQGTTVSQPRDPELKILEQVVETQTLVEALDQKSALNVALSKYAAVLDRSVVTARVETM